MPTLQYGLLPSMIWKINFSPDGALVPKLKIPMTEKT